MEEYDKDSRQMKWWLQGKNGLNKERGERQKEIIKSREII